MVETEQKTECLLKQRLKNRFILLPKGQLPPSFSVDPEVIGDAMVDAELDAVFNEIKNDVKKTIHLPEVHENMPIWWFVDKKEMYECFRKWLGGAEK